METKTKKRWLLVILILVAFTLFSFFMSIIASLFIDLGPVGNVALIPVTGVILVSGESGFGIVVANSEEIVSYIKEASEDPSIKAIVLDINSPGGSPVASKEIGDAIKKANKTTVAVIREVGASGGYWVASAADHIIANEMSITGSIGVIGSYIEFAGLLERYNMTYQTLTSGKYKGLGDPFQPLGSEERNILQSKLDKIHDIFIREVAANRGLPETQIRAVATGEFYLGVEAIELNLIDELGNMDSAEQWIKQNLELEEVIFAEYRRDPSLLSILTGVFSEQSFFIGRGIGSELKNTPARKLEILT